MKDWNEAIGTCDGSLSALRTWSALWRASSSAASRSSGTARTSMTVTVSASSSSSEVVAPSTAFSSRKGTCGVASTQARPALPDCQHTTTIIPLNDHASRGPASLTLGTSPYRSLPSHKLPVLREHKQLRPEDCSRSPGPAPAARDVNVKSGAQLISGDRRRVCPLCPMQALRSGLQRNHAAGETRASRPAEIADQEPQRSMAERSDNRRESSPIPGYIEASSAPASRSSAYFSMAR